MSSGAKPKNTKKTVRHVPSRYLQVSEKSSSGEKSSSLMKSSEESIVSSNFKSGREMIASTPMFFKDSSGDSSVPSMKERIVPSSTVRKIQRKKKSDKSADSFDQKLAEAEMELLYASYLQSAFLLSESKRALEARTSAAVEMLHKLLALVNEHFHKAKEQKDLLNLLNFLIEAHTHCKKQEAMLELVFEAIPTLEKQYKSLAEAVNTTKHNLLMKDVQLPNADEEVEKILQKMSAFVAGFLEALPNHRDIHLSVEDLKKYVDSAELLADSLGRGMDLLTEAKELCLSEACYALSSNTLPSDDVGS